MRDELARVAGAPLRVVAALYFLSGISGLMYQVLWLRLLSVVFGVTAYAASTVLASFMGGLALGSLIGGRLADRARRPLRWFAAIEAGIGVSALLTPWLLDAAQGLYAGVARSVPDTTLALTLARLACSAVILLLPTALMGATLPFVVRSVATRGDMGPRVGLLYAVNAGGAITGAILAGFYLIGGIGLRGTFLVAASLNLLVAVGAWGLSSRATPDAATTGTGDAALPGVTGARPVHAPVSGLTSRLVLLFFLLSGLASLALEVIWFRMLVLILPATTYAFTTMLATVLGGISAGSAIATRMLRRERDWVATLVRLNVGTAIAVLASRLILTTTYGLGWRTSGTIQASVVAILPSALLMGLAFPIALRAWSGSGDPDDPALARRIGVAYAVNMAGAIAGAILGGFVLLPLLGSQVSLELMAAVYIASGLMLATRVAAPRRVLLSVAAAVVLCAVLGRMQQDLFDVTIGRRYPHGERVLWREEGVQTTVSVNRAPGGTQVMYLDGLHQANDSFSMVQVHSQIGLFPLALHPSPREVLVIGLGGGVTAGAVSRHGGVDVDVVELSDSVVKGAARFAHVNNDVLRQPRVHMRVSDGRNYLALTDRRYDVITADIIQPQHAGAGLVYSREYFELARAALKDDGIMLQWIGHRAKVEYDLIMRTFLEVFPDATLWNGGTLMAGTRRPLTVSRAAFDRKRADRATAAALDSVGLGTYEALIGQFSGDAAAMRAFVGPGPLLTDDRPRIEYHKSLPDRSQMVDLSAFRGEGRQRVEAP
jgi:spermidine synthase